MAKIVRYNGNLQAFASAALGTERTIFGDVTQANDLTSQINADFLRGWGIVGPSDQPALEDFNGAMYTHGQLLAYLHQAGVPEYNAAQEYFLGSVTQDAGILYSSLQNSNIANPPATSPASWERIVSQGSLLDVRRFTSSGTYTPNPRAKKIIVTVVAGGGAASGTSATTGSEFSVSGGGGSGGYARALITAPASVTMTIGLGGVPVTGGTGGSGGSTSFGTILSATGGAGGTVGLALTTPHAIVGGAAGIGSVVIGATVISLGAYAGAKGLPGLIFSTINSSPGEGAGSILGGGGTGGSAAAGSTGSAAVTNGAGGGGSSNSGVAAARPGGAGAAGIIIVEEYA